MLGGFGGENANVILAAEWDHRSELDTQERSFSSLPYGVNPAPWSSLTNVATWFPRGQLPEDPGVSTSAEFGNAVGVVPDFTQESCEAVAGVYDPSDIAGFPSCRYGYIPYYNLVEETNTYRLYGQLNAEINEYANFSGRVAYARIHTPHAYGSPSQPVVRGPARATGAANQLYVPASNPHVEAFAERTGWADNPLSGLAQGFTPLLYRPFAHGGNHTTGEDPGTPREIDNKYWHISAGLDGTLDNGIGYDVALTYNKTVSWSDNPDVMGFRLQEALNGFGGPNCQAEDLNPDRFGTQNAAAAGTGNCMWYNPFASNFDEQPVLGAQNPSYINGGENPDELVRWLFDDREDEDQSWSATLDFVLDGSSPLTLGGGQVGWAAGLQWRQLENRESVPSDFYNGNTPCLWPNEEGQVPLPPDDPDFNGCTPDEPGPFLFFGTNEPDMTDQEQVSYFGELNLPILETLNATAAVRHERFNGGELDATVYKVSGRWAPTENLTFRGSYGTNYQAPPSGLVPGEVNTGVTSYTIAGGNWRGTRTETLSGIEPETATTWNAGVIWQSEGLNPGSTVEFAVDYFDIETEDEVQTLASANQIAEQVFSISPDGPDAPVPTDGSALADCSHPLVDRVVFNGSCVQGETEADDFAEIRTDLGNGPGQHTAGFDFQASYGMPFLEGDLQLEATATRVTTFEISETTLDGIQVSPAQDQLGFLNFDTIADAISKWRGNLTANYSQGMHNLRGVINYVGGVDDDRFIGEDGQVNEESLVPSGLQPGTSQPFGPTFFGVRGKNWITADLHYVVDLPWARLNASITNITDEAPPNSRQELGYDPRIGNPLERRFQIGIRREF